MQKKYKILVVLSIAAVFLTWYGFDYGETQLITKSKQSPVKKKLKPIVAEKLADNDDMVAAILIMPKSYLPALKRFSQSAMGRNIKILRAQLEVIDGKMTAVRYDKRVKQQGRKIEPANNPANKTTDLISKLPPDKENKILSTGFLYLLASIQNNRFSR